MNQPLVDIENLTFTWPGADQALLSCPSFQLFSGEHVFIRGPSGSGKSTLLGLLTGVLAANSGQLSILQQNMTTLGASQRDQLRADHIGYIFQQFNLVPYLNLADNVMLPCRFSKRRTDNAIKSHGSVAAAAEYLLQHLFEDNELDPRSPASKLSVGQQQRVAAARALIGHPEIVIADEPTSSLDFDARERFVNLLFDQLQETDATLVFVSHDQSLGGRFPRTLSIEAFRAGGEA